MMETKNNRENIRARLLERLKKNYTYDAERGGLISVRNGKLKDHMNHDGYLKFYVRMDGKHIYITLHHAVWALCHGRFPVEQIDHLNGDKQDNRIENLREVNASENCNNIRWAWKPNAKTGVPGVIRHHVGYQTKIRGRLLYFSNPYEAFFHATMCGKRYKRESEKIRK